MKVQKTKQFLSLILTLSLALATFILPVQAAGTNTHFTKTEYSSFMAHNIRLAVLTLDVYAINPESTSPSYDTSSYIMIDCKDSNYRGLNYYYDLVYIPYSTGESRALDLKSYKMGTPIPLFDAEIINAVASQGPGMLEFIIYDRPELDASESGHGRFLDIGEVSAASFVGAAPAAPSAEEIAAQEAAAAQAAALAAQEAQAAAEATPTAEEIAAAQAAAQAAAEAPAAETPAGTYTVEKGDCLFKIAQKAYGDGKLWRKIFEANRDLIRNQKDYIIYAGQNFVIPTVQ